MSFPAWARGLCAWFLMAAPALAAGPATLVADLNRDPVLPASSSAAPLVRLGGTVFLSARDPRHGEELWAAGSGGEGLHLFADLCPGPCDSLPANLTVIGSRLFFSAQNEALGRELWVSDGTPAGTHPVRDVCPGPCDSRPQPYVSRDLEPAELGGEVYFGADDGVHGFELWATDGTAAGTVPVADLNPGAASSYPTRLTRLGDALYFIAQDADHGQELWVTDVRGTRLLRDFLPGPEGSDLTILASSPQWILLAARLGPNADFVGVLAPDGSLRALGAPYTYGEAAVLRGDQAFLASFGRLDLYDLRTGAGTLLTTDVSGIRGLTAVGSRVFFVSSSGTSALWVSDGTPGGTRGVVSDIGVGEPIRALGDRALFSGYTPALGIEPWISDGTSAGTRPLKDIWPGPETSGNREGSSYPSDFLDTGATALFAASAPGSGRELWRTDGTEAGTVLAADGLPVEPAASGPVDVAAVGERLYFAATRSVPTFRETWTSDGTATGTVPLGPLSFNGFIPLAGRVYFFGVDPADRQRRLLLYRTDGTAGGTVSYPDVYFSPTELTPLAGAGRLLVADGTQPLCLFGCSELFSFEPASGQVILVRDIAPYGFFDPFMGSWQPYGSAPHDLTPLGNRVLFGANDTFTGDELWASDGTPAGTSQVADLCPGGCSSSPGGFAPLGGRLLFRAASAAAGDGSSLALWRTDGTAAGTVELASFPQAGIPWREAGPRELVAALGRIFFLVRFPGGDELWQSDGTAGGTRRVRALSLDGLPGSGRQLRAAGGRLFLAVANESTGEELWTSDGTAAGTRLVLDLDPGPAGASPQSLTAVDGRLLFAATDGVSGVEIWSSDGTAAGTFQIEDLAPGPAASTPGPFTLTASRIYFPADDGVHGRELWSMPRAAVAFRLCQPNDTTLCLGQGRFAVTVRFTSPGVPAGVGHVLPGLGGEQTGSFWFFSPGNAELLVKMLDGDAVNHHVWYFAGALSDVHYTVEVQDLATGLIRRYDNPAGSFCGRADTAAFPSPVPPGAAPAKLQPAGGCVPAAADAVCLGPAGRYRVEVSFRNPLLGGAPAAGQALPWSTETGFFWFFDPANLELAVKLLDGTPVNGHRWFFYGALSDVEYTITVTDTATGARRTYHNPPGQLCGGADVAAF